MTVAVIDRDDDHSAALDCCIHPEIVATLLNSLRQLIKWLAGLSIGNTQAPGIILVVMDY